MTSPGWWANCCAGVRRFPVSGTLYTAAATRAPSLLLDLVRRAAPKSGQLAVAEAVLAEIRQKSLPEPNIDFALATLARVAGMIRGAGEAVFAVARTAGWIAHALEEYAGDGRCAPGPSTPEGPRPMARDARALRRASTRTTTLRHGVVTVSGLQHHG